MTWRFATSLGSRVLALEGGTSFEALIAGILREMQILCVHCQYCDKARDVARAIYCVEVGAPLFDLFFNSATGYRAAYFRSPYEGLQNNAAFIDALAPRLLEWGDDQRRIELPFHRESLASPTAKAWLAETTAGLCDLCREWEHPQKDDAEIFNDRWEHELHYKARWGRKAPALTKIKIIGAFLDTNYGEFVAADKRHRAREIHLYGWA